MAPRHPHADATYRVVPLREGEFGVEVTIPERNPAMVTSFATEQAAQKWIKEHRLQVENSASVVRRQRFVRAPKS